MSKAMSEFWVSDPSRLHLKKELTQIKKAARSLKDPGTVSSWKSPVSGSRSAVGAFNLGHKVEDEYEEDEDNRAGIIRGSENGTGRKEKRVFLYNWKTNKSSRDDKEYESESMQESFYEDSLSDARNDTSMAEPRFASMIFRRERGSGGRRKSKKLGTHLNGLPRYQKKETNLRKMVNAYRSRSSAPSDTEDFSNSEDLRGKKWLISSSKLLGSIKGREDSSYSYSTPALSASSYVRYLENHPTTVGSWDGTTVSMADRFDDFEVDEQLELPGCQGCVIPCYWGRRTPSYCCSPSVSDSLIRKGSKILRHRKRENAGVIPLLPNGDGIAGSSLGTENSDDEISTNFMELDLEAVSRLDGRRWSNCGSQDEEKSPENVRSLSQKYKPVVFSDVIGQTIVVQSLSNAVSRGKISPVYLFQGPRGTGKTSTARIFACALNCRSAEETKPCGFCRECISSISGNSKHIWEIDGTSKKEVDKIKRLIKTILHGSPSTGASHRGIFIIDECHLLPSRMWLTFLKLFEKPMPQVVFIFITTDIDSVPRTVQSRCHRYIFNKIKEADIVGKLGKIAAEENLEVELQALDLIALNADGSLRDAETMLDQLSLLGKKITTSLVHDLLGVVADEKLLELLELAMSSDTAETVKRARDLLDSGVDPLVLMSQMAGLIMDIIAGMQSVSGAPLGRRILSESEMGKLKHALKVLSEAEKQLRVSNDRATWFTATLLQLSSVTSLEVSQTSSSRRQSSKSTEDDQSSTSREAQNHLKKSGLQLLLRGSSPPAIYNAAYRNPTYSKSPGVDIAVSTTPSSRLEVTNNYKKLWERCIDCCHSKTLRQLLHSHGKLLSVSKSQGILVAYVTFDSEEVRARAERFLSSITNSIEVILRQNVEVRIVCMPDDLKDNPQAGGLISLSDEHGRCGGEDCERKAAPMQRIESIIHEQKLETAWLQAAEMSALGSTRLAMEMTAPEKNQILPQDDVASGNVNECQTPSRVPLNDVAGNEITPSLLHKNSLALNTSIEQIGYDSSAGPHGCGSFWCWNTTMPCKKKVRRTPVHTARRRSSRFLSFSRCRKLKRKLSRAVRRMDK